MAPLIGELMTMLPTLSSSGDSGGGRSGVLYIEVRGVMPGSTKAVIQKLIYETTNNV
jgi:hypothetical protein